MEKEEYCDVCEKEKPYTRRVGDIFICNDCLKNREHRPTGKHLILEYFGCPFDKANDYKMMVELIQTAIKESGATYLKQIGHVFLPQGFTIVALLSESHVSVHTYPEWGYVAADVFTCGDTVNPYIIHRFLERALEPKNINIEEIKRGVN